LENPSHHGRRLASAMFVQQNEKFAIALTIKQVYDESNRGDTDG
jgi:hypothetical protein